MFSFVFDREYRGRPWPNLAPDQDVSQGYYKIGSSYPWTVPLRLLYYMQDHGHACHVTYVGQPIPPGSYYPVGLGWFSFDIDYFDLMSQSVLELIKSGHMKVLFYYHEGDNPVIEKQRLDHLCRIHDLPATCYRFVSGNSRADELDNFVYFADHELWHWRNLAGNVCEYHERPRTRNFTSLSRTHKWWRATVQSKLHQLGWLDQSYWSYNHVNIDDQPQHNPIELCQLPELESYIDSFLTGAPYVCDNLGAEQHNNHRTLVREHFDNSYCNIVLETLYDAEQSQGCFITEKTFKPIAHAQPFVIFGTVGSLAELKKLGYRTFDHVIDNSYDQEIDNTKRFIKTLNAIEQILRQDLHEWYITCKSDLEHNQALFVQNKQQRLIELEKKLESK